MSLIGTKVRIFYSSLGVILGLLGFCIFKFLYSYDEASIWALLSVIFAAINLHLHVLYLRNKLEDWYDSKTLDGLFFLGFITFLLSGGFVIWNLFLYYYKKNPDYLQERMLVSIVWSFMTTKWALTLLLTSRRYARLTRESYPSLLTAE